MANSKVSTVHDPEITAIGSVNAALTGLDPAAQRRVLIYVADKLGISIQSDGTRPVESDAHATVAIPAASITQTITSHDADDSDGMSPVALKWLKRSGLAAADLSNLFSLGVDEIDLVAKKVPGTSKKERMHSVLLLKGIASYLSTGAPRVTYEQVKEACLHYDAFDSANFAAYLKSFSSEVSGTKESGHTLTARGLTAATEIIKSMVHPKA